MAVISDDSSVLSSLSSDSNFGVSTLRRGGIDCTVLAGGRQFLAHRVVLAQRCPVLRDMLLMEEALSDSSNITQLLLPELRPDTAMHLLYFLYMDTLQREVAEELSLLRALIDAAKSLQIPRLLLICQQLLLVRNSLSNPTSEDILDAEEGLLGLELPPSHLTGDISALLGDLQYADVRFITLEGKGINAHRCVLEARCEYFRAMFRFRSKGNGGMDYDDNDDRDDDVVNTNTVVDIVVPDNFLTLLRLLLFLYSDTLPDGTDDVLMDDLLAADRFESHSLHAFCFE